MAIAAGMAFTALASHAASASTCPADLDGNGIVDGADLGSLLIGWGQPGVSDLDGNGVTDGADLGALLIGWGACPDPSPTTFVGFVVLEDGTPVADAVVVTDLGGTATTGKAGDYELSIDLAKPVDAVTLTAVATLDGVNYRGTAVVERVVLGDLNEVDLVVSEELECTGGFGWLPGFEAPGMSGDVLAMAVFDDGSGPALYVGGSFGIAGGPAKLIAKWDGSTWSSVGGGFDNSPGSTAGSVRALTVYDDGFGPALYAGGSFSRFAGYGPGGTVLFNCNLMKWDGNSWSGLGVNCFGSIRALAVFDDGAGAALYAGGVIALNEGFGVGRRVAKWDGDSWQDLGQTNGAEVVNALAAFDDGNGPRLYAGGGFSSIDGVPASKIAQWDGTSWSPVGSGMNNDVVTFAVFDDGTGSALYAGGVFTTAGGVSANEVARWDGSAWSPLGDGILNSSSVRTLHVFDDGQGPALYAGSPSGGGSSALQLSRWRQGRWETVSGSRGPILCLGDFNDGEKHQLFVGGQFLSAGGVAANRIAAWDGKQWSSLGGMGMGGEFYSLNPQVYTFATFDDGSGEALYAGGAFESAGPTVSRGIARWNGVEWTSLGGGIGGGQFGTPYVYALAEFDDGTGPAIYAAGDFLTVGGVYAPRIARWDGTAWSPLGSGMSGTVWALATFDDGTGPALYAGGEFPDAGGVTASRVARWDGKSWSPLGSGMNGTVWALATFDDGTGPALYAGGTFTTAGGASANRIAKWDGAQWTSLEAGVNGDVRALTVFDDGVRESLYAGGAFTVAGAVAAARVARWDGVSWASLGDGFDDCNPTVYALGVFDDGTGPALYAGGSFFPGCGGPYSRVARWDGLSWTGLGTGVGSNGSESVRSFGSFNDGSGSALFVGGIFFRAGSVGSCGIAKWGCVD